MEIYLHSLIHSHGGVLRQVATSSDMCELEPITHTEFVRLSVRLCKYFALVEWTLLIVITNTLKYPAHITFWYNLSCTNPMEQVPSRETGSHSTSQEILYISWNTKAHYCVHNSPPLVPFLSHMNPGHNFPPYVPKLFNFIFPSMPGSSNKVLQQKYFMHLSHPRVLHNLPVSSSLI
jgi:hypothetical protein